MDLWGDKNQDMTWEQVLKFVEAKEAGKRSASRLLLPQATDAVTGSSYRRRKKRQPRARPQSAKTLARTVGPEGMEETPQQESEELNVQPLAPNATIVTKTTILRKCAGAKMVRSQREAPNTKTQYSTHYAKSRRRTTPEVPPWITTSSTNSQKNG